MGRCRVCRAAFDVSPRGRGRYRVYCSPRCRKQAEDRRRQHRDDERSGARCRTCGLTKHERPGRWRIYCSTACRPYHDFHNLGPKSRPPCGWCGGIVPPTRLRYCSDACMMAVNRRKHERKWAARAAASGCSIEEIGERDLWLCWICGGHVKRKDATRDHVEPVCWGGPSEPWNLALAHMLCNARRNAGLLKPSELERLLAAATL